MKELTRKEEQILLAIYKLKDSASLITIREQILKFTGKSYSVGTIYAPLNRLHMNGFLDSNLAKIAESNKPIRYYKLSETGLKALNEQKEQTEILWSGFKSTNFQDSKSNV